jgi:hypothetical protein
MRVDPDTCTDPDILAAEVRRLQAVIAASDTLTDAEREAIVQAIGIVDWHKAYFSHLKSDEPLPSAALRGLLERTK